VATGLSIATLFIGIFVTIYGTLGFVADQASNTAAAAAFQGAKVGGYAIALNATTTASSHLTLLLMTCFSVLVVPVVLYIIWAYTHFTKRISVENLPAEETPAQAVGAY
jgi:cytochrome d ubiquinol oxidase subunit II